MESLTGGPRPFRHQGFLDRFPGNFTVTFDDLGRKTIAARSASNESLHYTVPAGFEVTEAELNASIHRQAVDPSVRTLPQAAAFTPFTGNLTVPLLTLHTTGDAFVPIEHGAGLPAPR